MSLSAETTLGVLRAVGEATRLRLVALLQHGELSVTDLTDICGQSQPRISRHLKLLAEAGVVDRHREGTWIYFSLIGDGPIRSLVDHITSSTDPSDHVLAADLDRLAVVRARRTDSAQQYFAQIAERWDEERSLHAPDSTVEAAIVEALGAAPYRSLADLGTGTGRMLQLLAESGLTPPDRIVGLDSSHSMLAVARSNLDRAAVRGVDLRQGDIYNPPLDRSAFDLVVIHQVLHFLDDPQSAVQQAASLVAPGGRLVIVDFAPHTLEFLRADHAHRRLGFRSDVVSHWLESSGLVDARAQQIEPAASTADESLTVTLWLAHRAADPSPRVSDTSSESAAGIPIQRTNERVSTS